MPKEKENTNKESNIGRKPNQKLKPYLVYNYLMKKTDKDHPVSMDDIVNHLKGLGIWAERRSVYKDIDEINKAVYMAEIGGTIEQAERAIQKESNQAVVYDPKRRKYYARYRHYKENDIRLLAECVYAAKFIDEKRSKSLVTVLASLLSNHQAGAIIHNTYLVDRVKTHNEEVNINIAKINAAMKKGIGANAHTPEKISFHYLKTTIQNTRDYIERRGGAKYVVSPFYLIINEGNYYLLAFDDKYKEIRTFRVDRMKDVERLGVPREGEKEFSQIDLSSYTQRVFSMFGGEKTPIQIRFVNKLLDSVVDRFGQKNVRYQRDGEDHFKVFTTIEISDQFFGWVCGFGNMAQIISPNDVVEKFKAFIEKIQTKYN